MPISIPSKFIFRKSPGKLEEDIARQIGMMYDDLYLAITTIDTAIFTLPIYADNAAAIAGGLTAGQLYRDNSDPDLVCIVH